MLSMKGEAYFTGTNPIAHPNIEKFIVKNII